MARGALGYTLLGVLALGCASSADAPRVSRAFEIRPVPPWQTTGTGRATLTAKGDLVLEVSVRGPSIEISRPEPHPVRPNLIWHLVEGTCAAWQRSEPGAGVLARWTIEPKGPDVQEFRYVVSKTDLGAMTRPHAVIAFRNGGGGPLYTCGDIPPFAEPAAARATATPTTRPSPTVPPDWQVVTAHDLLIPLPPRWNKTHDGLANSDRPDPAAPWIMYFSGPSVGPGAVMDAYASVSIWLWPSRSVDELVRTRYVQGNLSLVSEQAIGSSPRMHEFVGVASWSDQTGAGRYRARHLFVQADAERVVDVIVFGPSVPGTETEPTPEMRAIQEIVIGNIRALPPFTPEAGCPRTRSRDAAGVITSDGATGIVGDTYASSTNVNAAFVMVKRDATLGHRVEVKFEQVGSSAPASSVWYAVEASPSQVNPWGDVAYKLGVKPIGFANSCWRLLVDSADSGIVLFVGQ